MTDLRKAAEMALEALEHFNKGVSPPVIKGEFDIEVQALRQALAEPEQDTLGSEWVPCVKLPVIVHVRNQREGETHISTREGITPVLPEDLIMRGVAGEEYPIGRELFERTYTFDVDAVNMSQERVDETAKREHEPVAWGMPNADGLILDVICSEEHAREPGNYTIPLYTAPPKREWVGLTDEQITVLNFMLGADDMDGVWFGEQHPKEKGAFWWRNRLSNAFQDAAIEAKLKEKNGG